MLKIRHLILALGLVLSSAASAAVQVSIGINLPVYPQLVRVPSYPVYYAPRLQTNYFFYDGMYWVYQDDNWYASSWYNGPWGYVDSEVVPLFILRIPVRYYRQPPAYFYGWLPDAPPRWGDHWGPNWEQRRSGWDRWNHRAAPAPAPLPVYQRQYSGNRYPQQVQQQHELQQRNYRYQPRDPVVRQSYQEQAEQRTRTQQGTPQHGRQGAPERKNSRQQDIQRSMPRQQVAPPIPRPQPPQRGGENMQRPAPAPQQGGPGVQERRQPPQPNVNQREQQMQRSQGREEKQQGKDATREPKQGQGQGQGQGQDRGRDRNE
jgi:hypothetical protein